MMEAVRDWIADVVAITMLLSVAQALIPEGGIRRIFSFSGGLVLVVVLLLNLVIVKMLMFHLMR